MKFTKNIGGNSYVSDFSHADEIHCYNNGDGTFELEVQTWATDVSGEKKQITYKIPKAILGEIEMLVSYEDIGVPYGHF